MTRLLLCAVAASFLATAATGDLKVSPNHRFLMHADGSPFFYLGDTAWELFHRLNRDEAALYLANRAQKGFTVIQAVALAELDGLNTPNAYGDKPLLDDDPAKPNEAYFKHVDWIVEKAQEQGLYIGLLPTWGDKLIKEKWGKGPVVFNESNARAYGRFIGTRYAKQPNIIWILGGDRSPENLVPIWSAMAAGIKEGDGGKHLITYHPGGATSSADWLHKEPWLDFNMMQSGHGGRDLPNYKMIAKDYALSPVKPMIDGEPRYENHPVNWQPDKNGWFDQFDVRQALYWSVFAGGAGVTYGCHDVWQMLAPGREPLGLARGDWKTSLDLPAAGQAQYLRRLMLSRPYFDRVPDNSLIVGGQGEGADHVQATRGDGYAFVYIPTGGKVTVDAAKLGSKKLRAWWYDPRTGTARKIMDTPGFGTRALDPPGKPGRGNDWVLVLDDLSRNYPPPGAVHP